MHDKGVGIYSNRRAAPDEVKWNGKQTSLKNNVKTQKKLLIHRSDASVFDAGVGQLQCRPGMAMFSPNPFYYEAGAPNNIRRHPWKKKRGLHVEKSHSQPSLRPRTNGFERMAITAARSLQE